MVCNYFTGIHLEQQITYSTALMHNLCLKGISQRPINSNTLNIYEFFGISALERSFAFILYKKKMSRLRMGICPSMTGSVLQKLQSAGVVNVVDFVSHDLDVWATKTGVGYRELAAIRRALISEHAAPVVGGSSLFDVVVATTSSVSVGCCALDNLLEGGILTGEITEVVTDRSGSSEALVMNTIVTVVTAMNKNVVFVDLSNRFDASLLAAMLSSKTNVEDALKRVRVVKCFDVLELLGKLSKLCEAPGPSNDPFYSSLKLIIIDGIVDFILPSLSHIHNNAGCGYVSQIVRLLRLLTTDSCYAALLANGDGCAFTSRNTAVPRQTPVARLWCSVPDTRLDIIDTTAESNEHSGTDNSMASGRIRVTVGKSNRLALGQCVELEVDKRGLFT